MDTVVYGAAAGLGFAAYENLASLVQHKDMWRALAALRSVLTVPFTARWALIAGASLAVPSFRPSAGHPFPRPPRLGAHHELGAGAGRRAGRAARGVRFSAARAAASIPDLGSTTRLLTRFRPACLSASPRSVLRSAWCAASASIMRRAPTLRASGSASLRVMWALLLIGGGTGFAGVCFLLTSLHHWYVNPDRNLASPVPIGFASIGRGWRCWSRPPRSTLLGRNRMRTAAEGFSSAPGAAKTAARTRVPAAENPDDPSRRPGQIAIADEAAVREHWKAFLFEGILLAILGLAAMIVPPLAASRSRSSSAGCSCLRHRRAGADSGRATCRLLVVPDFGGAGGAGGGCCWRVRCRAC